MKTIVSLVVFCCLVSPAYAYKLRNADGSKTIDVVIEKINYKVKTLRIKKDDGKFYNITFDKIHQDDLQSITTWDKEKNQFVNFDGIWFKPENPSGGKFYRGQEYNIMFAQVSQIIDEQNMLLLGHGSSRDTIFWVTCDTQPYVGRGKKNVSFNGIVIGMKKYESIGGSKMVPHLIPNDGRMKRIIPLEDWIELQKKK